MTRRLFVPVLALMLSLCASSLLGADAPAQAPRIQIAVLLDTSSSMSGLIDQARSHLWKIVNEFATARLDGATPSFEVALYEYGNSGLDPQTGWIRQVLPLTTDLDKVSEELFKLTTRGGSEHCGQVIDAAVTGLAWSESSRDYRAIFIAGNEPFTQGPVNYVDACKAAIAKGIIVNTIHCGPYDTGVAGKWLDGAQLADGTYSHIGQNQRAVHIPSPQDSELLELNGRLNATYVRYGASATEASRRQADQDRLAEGQSSGIMLERVAAKAGSNYLNAGWDLVDASRAEGFDIAAVKDADLPEELRNKTDEEKKAYIDGRASERAAIQARIAELSKARDAHVVAERARLAGEQGEASLEDAILGAVRKQLVEKDYTFESR
jgi:hypothetical protein